MGARATGAACDWGRMRSGAEGAVRGAGKCGIFNGAAGGQLNATP
jgi:hypothetical protein